MSPRMFAGYRVVNVNDWQTVTVEPGQTIELKFSKILKDGNVAHPFALDIDGIIVERLAGELIDEKQVALELESYNLGTSGKRTLFCGRPGKPQDPYTTTFAGAGFIVPVGRRFDAKLVMSKFAKAAVTLRVEIQGKTETR